MADAIKRLRALPQWDKWITFHAEGMGSRVDSYHFAAIRMRQGEIALERPLDVDMQKVTKASGGSRILPVQNRRRYSIAKATPIQAARIMDVIFRQYFGHSATHWRAMITALAPNGNAA